ncbi:DUF72 domain-containing protein [Paraburkholderia sp. J63]|uniref:DUF72 domain-containing protein n=1 Tax=Paraburkholderia sp. J63 TaxID=2805434 RepID=UPI002ABE74E8|nr:DUF72 domain-containing protein [Paraburkholderia sp. J63]
MDQWFNWRCGGFFANPGRPSYAGWRGTFYPQRWPQKRELEFAARAVQTIEINGTHYSLQSPAAFQRFRDETATLACANFFAQGLLALNEKLGPLLWQFPPNYAFDAGRFERFLALLPPDTEAAVRLAKRHDARVGAPWLAIDCNRSMRHAVEIRHASFLVPAFVDLLRRYRMALVVSDSTEPWPYAEDATADFAYARLHGSTGKYAGAYSDAALDEWHPRFKGWGEGKPVSGAQLIAPAPKARDRRPRDVYCYFDNDQKTEAPFDAHRLMTRFGFAREPLARGQ